MSEKEINLYRLTDTETEPSDEMLDYIMREVAEDAKSSNELAEKEYFLQITKMYQQKYVHSL
ncbi:MAG: hypothetical protein IJT61_01740 [Bacteroidales bacterium]|nr:hypothetical protein [Bacteroidales bacterium]